MPLLLASVALAGTLLGHANDPRPVPPTVPHYDMQVTLAPATGTLSAVVTIHLASPSVGVEQRFLLGQTFTIATLEATGAAVSAANVDQPFRGLQLITVTPRTANDVTVRIVYSGPLSAFVNPPMNHVSAELIELSVDSFWMPFQATLGSPFTVDALFRGIPTGATIVTADPHTITADGLRIRRTTSGGDLNLVAAPGLRQATEGRFAFFAADLRTPIAQYYRLHGAGSLGFLEKLLGPLPTPAASIAIVRRESRSGYARPGYIIVTEKVDAKPFPGDAKFIAHELSHGWFSRASFLNEDYWLVETPAEYLGLRYVRETLGPEAFEELVAPKRESLATAGPILGSGRASSAALYSKGPLLFFELEQRLGLASMDRVLGELGRSPVHTTAAFFEILRRVGGAEVARDLEAKMRAKD